MEPTAIILIGLSAFSIVFTFTVLILLTIRKLKSKPRVDKKSSETSKPSGKEKTEKTSKFKSILSSFSMISLVVVAIVLGLLIVVVLITKDDIAEENMTDIINGTTNVLLPAKSKLDAVSLSILDTSVNEIATHIEKVMLGFEEDIGFDDLSKKDYYSLVDKSNYKMLGFQKAIEVLQTNSPCVASTDIDKDKLEEKVANVKIQAEQLTATIQNIKTNNSVINELLKKQGGNQMKLDAGKSKFENHLTAMKKMMNQFQADVDKSEATRQEWKVETSKSVSDFDTQSIVKILVTGACGFVILLSVVTVVAFICRKFLGVNVPSTMVLISIYITGVVTVIASIIAIIVGLGEVHCPLNLDGFGLSNFTNSSICDTSDSKFFAGLGDGEIVPSDSIMQTLQIEEYKQKMLSIFTSSNISKIEIASHFSPMLQIIETSSKKLDTLAGGNCLGADEKRELKPFQKALNNFLDESRTFKSLAETFNGNVENAENIFKTVIDASYAKIIRALKGSVNDIQKKISDVDFSCNSIIAIYAKTGQLICKQFESPLDFYWICLIFSLIGFLLSIILQTLIYKWFASSGSDSKPGSDEALVNPSPSTSKNSLQLSKKLESGKKTEENVERFVKSKSPIANSKQSNAESVEPEIKQSPVVENQKPVSENRASGMDNKQSNVKKKKKKGDKDLMAKARKRLEMKKKKYLEDKEKKRKEKKKLLAENGSEKYKKYKAILLNVDRLVERMKTKDWIRSEKSEQEIILRQVRYEPSLNEIADVNSDEEQLDVTQVMSDEDIRENQE